jgi:hypothetical protein
LYASVCAIPPPEICRFQRKTGSPRASFDFATESRNSFPISSVMISANFSSPGTATRRSFQKFERSVNVVRRYFRNACSARLNRFSISASSKGENFFSFSPVAD